VAEQRPPYGCARCLDVAIATEWASDSSRVSIERRLTDMARGLEKRHSLTRRDAAAMAAGTLIVLLAADPSAAGGPQIGLRATRKARTYYRGVSPPPLLEVIRVGHDRPSISEPKPASDPTRLLDYLALLLGANLHVHLNGTGPAEMWSQRARELGHREIRTSPTQPRSGRSALHARSRHAARAADRGRRCRPRSTPRPGSRCRASAVRAAKSTWRTPTSSLAPAVKLVMSDKGFECIPNSQSAPS
jgi:hypothetical protein